MTADPHFCFLIATERSGSNLITSLMNAHSRISGPPPTHLFRLFANNRENYGDLQRDEAWEALIEDVVLNFECQLGSWSTSVSGAELRRRATERNVAELLHIVYTQEAEHDGASHVFVKENHTWSFAPFLLAHFPECSFVLLTRDPRDVASSWVLTDVMPGGVAEAVKTWTEDQRGALDVRDQLDDAGRVLLVRYEELLENPKHVLAGLVQHLGLSYEEGMLDFNSVRRTRINAERVDAWANLKVPVMRNNAGKFREALSEVDQRYVELACFDLMGRFGYVSELVAEPPDPARLETELEGLRRELSGGAPRRVSREETVRRRRRLAAIHRVLKRRLPT